MSFDDLAKTLAQPMPRRRALRLLGSAVAVAVLPGLRARPAGAHAKKLTFRCGPGTEPCSRNGLDVCMPEGGTCCWFSPKESGYEPWGIVVGCPPGTNCGTARRQRCICPPEHRCGQDGCCPETEFCASPNRSLCCKKGQDACLVPNRPEGTCCDKNERCCSSPTRADCCGEKQACHDGACRCPKTQPVKCGRKCCKKGIKCCDPKKPCCTALTDHCCGNVCCKKNQTCCGDTCCDPTERCCGKELKDDGCCPKNQACCATDAGQRCCKKGEFCANIAGGHGNKNCCPTARIATPRGIPVCCPTGTVEVPGKNSCCPPDKLDCCDPTPDPTNPDLTQLAVCNPGGFKLCVNGECLSY